MRGWNLGFCHLPELQIGEVTLVNWPCLYLERQMKPALFELSIGGDDSIIVGLPALREFKYILFDNIRGEVEFSNGELFGPGEPELSEPPDSSRAGIMAQIIKFLYVEKCSCYNGHLILTTLTRFMEQIEKEKTWLSDTDRDRWN